MPRHHDDRRPRPSPRVSDPGTRWRASAVAVGLALAGIAVLWGYANQDPTADVVAFTPHVGPSAAIVDQLSLTFPNASFVQQATETLHDAGYVVDSYAGANVTVGFYQRLPDMGYDILILRGHSTADHYYAWEKDVVLFTNENYSHAKHVHQRRHGLLASAVYDPGDTQSYFTVWPDFFERAKGDFDGALVFVMGCQGLANPTLADAFFAKGAATYLGWNTTVTADRTDTATLHWLRSYLGGATIQDAVDATMNAIGEDPRHGSWLDYLVKETTMKKRD